MAEAQVASFEPPDQLHTFHPSSMRGSSSLLINTRMLLSFFTQSLTKQHSSNPNHLLLQLPHSRDFLTRFLSQMAGTGVFAEILDGDEYKYYSDGEWKKSSSSKTVSIINPTTRKHQYKVQACTQEEVNKVMDSAKAAQKSWAKTPLWKRAELLHNAAAILKEHKTSIAECLVKEIAKPAKDAVTEVHILQSVPG